MNRKLSLIITAFLASYYCYSQNFVSKDLRLYNVATDQEVAMNHFDSHTAVVMVFTSLHCPYAKLYKDRVSALSQRYSDQNVRFVFVNANLSDPSKRETIAKMKMEAKTTQNDVHYFADKNHSLRKLLNVEKNPEVIILTPSSRGFQKVYQGAIDDSPQSESEVSQNYVEMTLNNLLSDQAISIAYQSPVGCRIK